MTAAFTPDQHEADLDASQCRALWLAVLDRAILDATGRVTALAGNSSGKEAREYTIRQAVNWFGSADFRTVCELAGVGPKWVLVKVRPASPDVRGKAPVSAYPDAQVGAGMTKETRDTLKRTGGPQNGATEVSPEPGRRAA